VPDEEPERLSGGDLLNDFATFLSSPPVVEWFRKVVGNDAIGFTDAQATAYGPGDFLTAHTDLVEGKQRHAAYVMNLTLVWSGDWGGLLLFHSADGHVERAFVPAFNAINLFAVPTTHSVSQVASYVPYRRFAVTGWLRSRA